MGPERAVQEGDALRRPDPAEGRVCDGGASCRVERNPASVREAIVFPQDLA